MSTSIPDARPSALPPGGRKPSHPDYPDSDGKPMSDNTLQFKWIVTIKEGLEAQFRDRPDVFVAGDLLWYPVLGSPKIRSAPDALVVFGRPKGYRGSYMQWEEDGIAPQVVFEVLSPNNTKSEMRRKLAFYETYGVEEYYLYDPDHGDLSGWTRDGETLKPVAPIDGFTSPRLGVTFHPAGRDALEIIGPDGRPFTAVVDVFIDRDAQRERAEVERRRAEAERQRAEQERLNAQKERERAERLAARLRELGVDDV